MGLSYFLEKEADFYQNMVSEHEYLLLFKIHGRFNILETFFDQIWRQNTNVF